MTLDLSALDGAALRAGAPMRAPLSRFEEDPENPRFEPDGPEFADFVADVAKRGILQPLVVREVDGKLRIRFGARRYRAGRQLDLPDLPYVITEDERQFDDYSQVAENEKRKGLQPLELATFVAKRIGQGETKKAVAANLQINPSAVTHLLSLIDAPAFLLELYHAGKCRAPSYLYELRKLHAVDSELVEGWCASVERVDARFLASLAEAVDDGGRPSSPPAHDAPASDPPAGATAASSGASASPSDGPADTAPAVQAAPAAARAREVGIKHPLLLGIYRKREVTILLGKRPSAAGRVLVRLEDGAEEEVAMRQVVMTLLTEGNS